MGVVDGAVVGLRVGAVDGGVVGDEDDGETVGVRVGEVVAGDEVGATDGASLTWQTCWKDEFCRRRCKLQITGQSTNGFPEQKVSRSSTTQHRMSSHGPVKAEFKSLQHVPLVLDPLKGSQTGWVGT